MPRLHLSFLGKPEVRHGEQPLAFRTRKTLALLLYLVATGEMHTREKLATLFWPESEHESGRANLRSTLLYLRKALKHAVGQESPDHLIVERDGLGFNFASDLVLDLRQINQALQLDNLSGLQTAADAVRGEFLEGFSLPDAPAFDEWLTWQREQWHLRLNTLFDRLSQRQEDSGEIAATAKTLNRWLALNPLEERAYRRLMRVRFRAGDRSGALQTYELCRQMLRVELGVEPDPKTQTLAERIRLARDEGRRPREISRRSPSSFPFMGRSPEHQQLVAVFQQARQGATQIVSVEGEAGIGKSRLVDAFLGWARGQGALVLHGRAYETGGRLPYQPLAGALRRMWDAPEAPATRLTPSLSTVWLAELSRLLPEVGDRYPNLPEAATDETTAQTRLFEAVARLLLALAERQPLLLSIDDVQWADDASRDLIQYIVQRLAEQKTTIMLLLTVRQESLAWVAGGLSLVEWMGNLERAGSLHRLRLGPLAMAAIQDLVGALAGSGVAGRPFARWLYRETDGHPFYVIETLSALLEQNMLCWRQDPAGEWRIDLRAIFDVEGTEQTVSLQSFIPAGVREVVRARLSRLERPAFALLAAGAVLSQGFSFAQLCRVAGIERDVGLGALDQLLAAGLLVEGAPGDQGYQFSHDKIRDVVYTEAGDARRALFHERAFRHLKAVEAPPARLAHHALAAGLYQDAFDYHLAAGDEAMALFAVRDAISLYERARQLLRQESAVAPQPSQRRSLHERLGRAYELVNRWQDALAVYQDMLRDARTGQQSDLEVAALTRLAGATIMGQWEPQQAIAYLETARLLAEAQDDRAGLVEVNGTLSQVLQYEFERDKAVQHAEHALVVARQIGNDELVARSLNLLSYARFGPPAALAQIEAEAAEAQVLFARVGNRALEADSLAVVAHTQTHQGRVHEALENLRQAQAIVGEIENSWGQVNVSFHLAFALLEVGQPEAALAVIEEGVRVAKRHGHDTLLANTLSVRGTVQRALGRLEIARADHAEAQARSGRLPFKLIPDIIAVHLAADCALAGDWEAAARYAQQSRAVGDLTWLWVWSDTGFCYHHTVEALWRGGREVEAETALAQFAVAVGDNRRYRIPYHHARAVLARGKGQWDEAVGHLQMAVTLAEELKLPGEAAQARAAQAALNGERW